MVRSVGTGFLATTQTVRKTTIMSELMRRSVARLPRRRLYFCIAGPSLAFRLEEYRASTLLSVIYPSLQEILTRECIEMLKHIPFQYKNGEQKDFLFLAVAEPLSQRVSTRHLTPDRPFF